MTSLQPPQQWGSPRWYHKQREYFQSPRLRGFLDHSRWGLWFLHSHRTPKGGLANGQAVWVEHHLPCNDFKVWGSRMSMICNSLARKAIGSPWREDISIVQMATTGSQLLKCSMPLTGQASGLETSYTTCRWWNPRRAGRWVEKVFLLGCWYLNGQSAKDGNRLQWKQDQFIEIDKVNSGLWGGNAS